MRSGHRVLQGAGQLSVRQGNGGEIGGVRALNPQDCQRPLASNPQDCQRPLAYAPVRHTPACLIFPAWSLLIPISSSVSPPCRVLLFSVACVCSLRMSIYLCLLSLSLALSSGPGGGVISMQLRDSAWGLFDGSQRSKCLLQRNRAGYQGMLPGPLRSF